MVVGTEKISYRVLPVFYFYKSMTIIFFFLFQPSVYELIRQPNFASLPIIVEDFVKDSGATFSGRSLLMTSTLFCVCVEYKHLHAHLTQFPLPCSFAVHACRGMSVCRQFSVVFPCCVAGSTCSAGRGEVHKDLGLFSSKTCCLVENWRQYAKYLWLLSSVIP